MGRSNTGFSGSFRPAYGALGMPHAPSAPYSLSAISWSRLRALEARDGSNAAVNRSSRTAACTASGDDSQIISANCSAAGMSSSRDTTLLTDAVLQAFGCGEAAIAQGQVGGDHARQHLVQVMCRAEKPPRLLLAH